MKIYIKGMALFLGFFINSCEEVIDVDLQTTSSKLVIEASINWEKGTDGIYQSITLSKSTAYFDEGAPIRVDSARVQITNTDTNELFVFNHLVNGIYTTSTFKPILNNTYSLRIDYNGDVYSGQEILTSVPDIETVNQSKEDGFNVDTLEVNVVFNDPENEDNFYMFKFYTRGELLPSLEVGSDTFVNGNEITWWHEKGEDEDTSELEAYHAGDTVDITFFGVSEDYYNYMNILVNQSNGADLFSTTPVPLKGNCINTTTTANFAYGYFRLSQIEKRTYVFQ